ncbi:MAG TPA: Crp/Fnr family transcriptional regulator [Burkholderiales bacterium]|nr:Crp/Fnr family transcriptional regulator [Burkholderiales bacterium]
MRSPAHAPNGGSAVDGNRILGSLGADDLRLLEPVDVMRLPARYLLLEAGDPIRHLYFPASGVVSFVQLDARGARPEVAQVGVEGVIGVAALLGAERSRHRAVVRIPGFAYRVPVSSARRAFAQSPVFQGRILTYAELVIRQLSQSVVCKLSHSVEQQFCQHLLVYADRVPGVPLEMTHEQIAEALGSRRQGITEAARRLQTQQVIAYSRGRISVLDRAALERSACDCYRIQQNAL